MMSLVVILALTLAYVSAGLAVYSLCGYLEGKYEVINNTKVKVERKNNEAKYREYSDSYVVSSLSIPWYQNDIFWANGSVFLAMFWPFPLALSVPLLIVAGIFKGFCKIGRYSYDHSYQDAKRAEMRRLEMEKVA